MSRGGGLAPIIIGVVAASASVTLVATSAAEFKSKKAADKKTDLGERPLVVNEAVMHSSLGRLYEFTHKAIWAVRLRVPSGTHTVRKVVNVVKKLPPTEHWALVVRAISKVDDCVAYFIAQFGDGDFIHPADEVEKKETENPFIAYLQENNKQHAAYHICQGVSDTDVWLVKPQSTIVGSGGDTKRYVHKGKKVVSEGFVESDWVKMKKPLQLRQLNAMIYETPCSCKDYDIIKNNCQDFAKAMFDKL